MNSVPNSTPEGSSESFGMTVPFEEYSKELEGLAGVDFSDDFLKEYEETNPDNADYLRFIMDSNGGMALFVPGTAPARDFENVLGDLLLSAEEYETKYGLSSDRFGLGLENDLTNEGVVEGDLDAAIQISKELSDLGVLNPPVTEEWVMDYANREPVNFRSWLSGIRQALDNTPEDLSDEEMEIRDAIRIVEELHGVGAMPNPPDARWIRNHAAKYPDNFKDWMKSIRRNYADTIIAPRAEVAAGDAAAAQFHAKPTGAVASAAPSAARLSPKDKLAANPDQFFDKDVDVETGKVTVTFKGMKKDSAEWLALSLFDLGEHIGLNEGDTYTDEKGEPVLHARSNYAGRQLIQTGTVISFQGPVSAPAAVDGRVSAIEAGGEVGEAVAATVAAGVGGVVPEAPAEAVEAVADTHEANLDRLVAMTGMPMDRIERLGQKLGLEEGDELRGVRGRVENGTILKYEIHRADGSTKHVKWFKAMKVGGIEDYVGEVDEKKEMKALVASLERGNTVPLQGDSQTGEKKYLDAYAKKFLKEQDKETRFASTVNKLREQRDAPGISTLEKGFLNARISRLERKIDAGYGILTAGITKLNEAVLARPYLNDLAVPIISETLSAYINYDSDAVVDAEEEEELTE